VEKKTEKLKKKKGEGGYGHRDISGGRKKALIIFLAPYSLDKNRGDLMWGGKGEEESYPDVVSVWGRVEGVSSGATT